MNRYSILLTAAFLSLTMFHCGAQGTMFTYQGRLTDGSNAYSGNAEFQPTLWNDPSAGSPVATNNPSIVIVAVTNGLFVVPLDFGGAPLSAGADRWLQFQVRTAIGPFTTLAPRQKLTPTPYAITAQNVTSGGIAAGIYSNAVSFNNSANSFTGNGAGVTNVNAVTLGGLSSTSFWRTTGNAGTTPGTHFLGTTDNQPLELKVNGQRALRFELFSNGAPNVVGGSAANFVSPGVIGATIAGGGAVSLTNYFEEGANSNYVSAIFGTIGGGRGNTISVDHGTIGGGLVNTISNGGFDGAIGGGYQNTVLGFRGVVAGGAGNFNGGSGSVIGGGGGNTIALTASDSVIAGGSQNVVRSNVSAAVVAGGQQNSAGGLASTISGGNNNTISSGAFGAGIGGGQGNMIGVNASYATIPGGYYNTASAAYSFAAGRYANANHDGTFIWSDSAAGPAFSSTGPNQFLIRAAGGVGIDTPNPQAKLDVRGDIRLGSTGQYYAPGASENVRIVRGVVNSAGTILNGTGFTVTKTGTGAYTISFAAAFDGSPAVTVSAQSGLSFVATCTGVSTSSAGIRTFLSNTGAATDNQFNFIAIGLR